MVVSSLMTMKELKSFIEEVERGEMDVLISDPEDTWLFECERNGEYVVRLFTPSPSKRVRKA